MDGHWDGPEVLSAPGTSSEVILTAECPVVAHRQGAADLCSAYGLASAVHEYGDAIGAAAIAGCARAALASSDAFGHVIDAVRSDAAGWSSGDSSCCSCYRSCSSACSCFSTLLTPYRQCL